MSQTAPEQERPKVLLLAYACSPYRGGEPGVGWHRAVETAKFFDTWVLCKQQSYEKDIRKFLAAHGDIKGLHFHFIPRTRFEKLLKKTKLFFYLAYNLWHRRAYRLAVQLHQQHHFDLVHMVNFNGFREPGYLWKLGPPYVWGPVGGTQNYPPRFLRFAGWRGALLEGIRGMVNHFQFRFGRRIRQAAKRAALILAANSTGQRDFARVYHQKPVRLLETGIAAIPGRAGDQAVRPSHPLRLLWSGALGHRKALPLLLHALSQLPAQVAYELRVVGDGPLTKRWQRLARRLGVAPHCTWTGVLPHDQALAQYEWADVFVFTSLRDTSGNVVLESLAYGVPVICLDHQGVGDIVTPECGIKIPVTTPEAVISALREAIVAVAAGQVDLEALSRGAVEVAKTYHWSVNSALMAEFYYDLIGEKAQMNQTAHNGDPASAYKQTGCGQPGAKPHLVRVK